MATPITKNSGIDNWWSEIPGTIEVWWFGKKCWIEHKTGKIIKDEGVSQKSQAFRMAMEIAKETR